MEIISKVLDMNDYTILKHSNNGNNNSFPRDSDVLANIISAQQLALEILSNACCSKGIY